VEVQGREETRVQKEKGLTHVGKIQVRKTNYADPYARQWEASVDLGPGLRWTSGGTTKEEARRALRKDLLMLASDSGSLYYSAAKKFLTKRNSKRYRAAKRAYKKK
jgi:hypothetical protein